MKNRLDPLVSVCCIAFNQAPFIRRCLDGVLRQKCSFPFEVIVHDDASTDGTAEIIREYAARYPDQVTAICQKENQYSKGMDISVAFVWPRARGKFIALCEGDDYWTSPEKLQKQVSFLDAHPEYSMSFSDYAVEKCFGKEYRIPAYNAFLRRSPESITRNDIFSLVTQSCPATCTLVFRKEMLDLQACAELCRNLGFSDIVYHCLLAQQGKFHYVPEPLGCYRRACGSVTQANAPMVAHKRHQKEIRDRLRVAEYFGCRGEELQRLNDLFEVRLLGDALFVGEYREAYDLGARLLTRNALPRKFRWCMKMKLFRLLHCYMLLRNWLQEYTRFVRFRAV